MILPDVNLFIYAVNQDAPLHRQAKSWLEEALSGPETVGLSWLVLLAFLRVSTRPGAFTIPLSPQTAFDLVDTWLAAPATVIVEPTAQHPRLLRDLLSATGTAGNLTSDAHLAALAIAYNAELCSADSDFQRFPRLRYRNPLQ